MTVAASAQGLQEAASSSSQYLQGPKSSRDTHGGAGGAGYTKSSTQHSITNLINCILSAAILSYPYCFKTCGFVLTVLIMIGAYFVTRLSYQFLLYSCQLSTKRSFEDLAEQACGKIGRWTIDLCSFSINMGCMVAYLNMMADVLSSVAGTIIPPGAEPSRNAYVVGVTVFGAFPMAMFVRDHALMTNFSKVSVLFMSIFCGIIVIFAISPEESITAPVSSTAEGDLVWWNMDGLLVAFPMISYSFTGHPYYLGIYSNLHQASIPKMLHVTDMAMGTIALMYAVVGGCGYITFKDRTAGDLLRNIGGAHLGGFRGMYERSVKLCYGLSILVSIPIVVLPFYNIILPLLGYDLSAGQDKKVSNSGSGSPLPRNGTGSYGQFSDSEFAPLQAKPGGAASRENGSRGGNQQPTTTEINTDGCSTGSTGTTSDEWSPVIGGNDKNNAKLNKLFRRQRSTEEDKELDVVDFKLQHDGLHTGPSANSGDIYSMIDMSQHTIVVTLVLSFAMACALFVPNVEFIFGISGSTASVLIGFIMPPLVFMRLLDNSPEMAPSRPKHPSSWPPEVQNRWRWRRFGALTLIIFGCVSGVICTNAVLNEVQEEAAVVQLAQQLLAQEVVVEQASRAQARAKEAVEAIDAVESASKQLGYSEANANHTMESLQAAADALSSIANDPIKGAKHGKKAWDLSSGGKDSKKHASDTKVLKSVEALLQDVRADLSKTYASVQAVVVQLNSTLAKLQAEALALDSKQGTGSTSSSTGVVSAPQKAAALASDLEKALGSFKHLTSNVTAGKSLEAVRANAIATDIALNQTIQIIDKVTKAVKKAKTKNKRADEVRKAAVEAMQAALNATATSSLAMKLTTEALEQSAENETDELLIVLTKVAADLEQSKKSKLKSSGSGGSSGDGKGSNVEIAVGMGSDASALGSSSHDKQTTLKGPPPPSSTAGEAVSLLPNGTATTNSTKSAHNRERIAALKKVMEQLNALTEAGDGDALPADIPIDKLDNITVTATAVAEAALTAAEMADEDDLKSVSAVLKEAMKWTEGSQGAVLKELNSTLSKANSKVQSRVVGILKDISDAKEWQAATTVLSTEEDPGPVTGPVVTVTKDGSLLQKEDNKAEQGDVVDLQETPSSKLEDRGHGHGGLGHGVGEGRGKGGGGLGHGVQEGRGKGGGGLGHGVGEGRVTGDGSLGHGDAVGGTVISQGASTSGGVERKGDAKKAGAGVKSSAGVAASARAKSGAGAGSDVKSDAGATAAAAAASAGASAGAKSGAGASSDLKSDPGATAASAASTGAKSGAGASSNVKGDAGAKIRSGSGSPGSINGSGSGSKGKAVSSVKGAHVDKTGGGRKLKVT